MLTATPTWWPSTTRRQSDISVLLGGSGGTFSTPTNYAVGSFPQSVADRRRQCRRRPRSRGPPTPTATTSRCCSAAPGDRSARRPTSQSADYPTAVAIGDFNGDGQPDLAVPNGRDDTISILLGESGGTFGAPTNLPVGSYPSAVVTGDFNGDGERDLAVSNYWDGTCRYCWVAPVRLSVPPPLSQVAMPSTTSSSGDFNGDGDPDLALVTNRNTGLSILLGGPSGTFGTPTTLAVPAIPVSAQLAVGDLNADSHPVLAFPSSRTTTCPCCFRRRRGQFRRPNGVPDPRRCPRLRRDRGL